MSLTSPSDPDTSSELLMRARGGESVAVDHLCRLYRDRLVTVARNAGADDPHLVAETAITSRLLSVDPDHVPTLEAFEQALFADVLAALLPSPDASPPSWTARVSPAPRTPDTDRGGQLLEPHAAAEIPDPKRAPRRKRRKGRARRLAAIGLVAAVGAGAYATLDPALPIGGPKTTVEAGPGALIEQLATMGADSAGGPTEFRGRALTSEDFAGDELRAVDFGATTITDVDFAGTDLSEANFTAAVIKDTSFVDADLTAVDFSEVSFDGVDFAGSDVSGADFTGATFTGGAMTGEWDPSDPPIGLNE